MKDHLIEQIYSELRQTGKWLTPQEIKDIRRSYRLTQSGFAELLGISFGTYKNWETGYRGSKRKPRIFPKFPSII